MYYKRAVRSGERPGRELAIWISEMAMAVWLALRGFDLTYFESEND